MKVFVLDAGGGVGLDFALRCQMAGHEVRVYFKPGKHPRTGEGLVKRVSKWQDHMKWADLIFMTDNTRYHKELAPYFKEGYPIFGPNPQSAALELDREYGQKVLHQCGIPVPSFKVFSNYDEAISYVRHTNERFVSKPCGDEEDKSLSYVSKSPADMIFMLERWKKQGRHKGKFMLQEFIGGIEMGVSGWFGPDGWSSVWMENFEHKKLMNDDKGMNTGEMGTALKYVKESALAQEVLEPVGNALAALGYVGACDMNVIIDDYGQPWPLEFTARPGWPLFYIQTSVHQGDPCEWMLDKLHGKDTLKVNFDHAVGVVLAIPDFPYSHLTHKEVEGIPLYGVNKGNIDHIHFGEIMSGKAPCMEGDKIVDKELFVTAGDYVATVVGLGKTVEKAKHSCYNRIDEIELPNSPMYRTDIGHRLEKQLPLLQKHGFATDWEYGED